MQAVEERKIMKFCLRKPCNMLLDLNLEPDCDYICPKPCKCLFNFPHPCVCCQCTRHLPSGFVFLSSLRTPRPRQNFAIPAQGQRCCTCETGERIPCVPNQLNCPCPVQPQCSCQGIPKQQPIPAPACNCPPNQPKCNCPVQHPCSCSAQILKPTRVLPITSVSTAKNKPAINCVCPMPTRPCTCPQNQPNCNCPIQHPCSCSCSCSNQGVKLSRVIQTTNAPTSEQKRPINCVCPIPTRPCTCLPNQPNCNCPIQHPCSCSSQGVKPSRVIQITNAPTSEQKRPINCVCPIPTRPCTCLPNQPNCNCPIQHPCSCSNQGVKPSRVIQITNAPTSEQKRPINCVCPIPAPPCIFLPNQPNCKCQHPCSCPTQILKSTSSLQSLPLLSSPSPTSSLSSQGPSLRATARISSVRTTVVRSTMSTTPPTTQLTYKPSMTLSLSTTLQTVQSTHKPSETLPSFTGSEAVIHTHTILSITSSTLSTIANPKYKPSMISTSSTISQTARSAMSSVRTTPTIKSTKTLKTTMPCSCTMSKMCISIKRKHFRLILKPPLNILYRNWRLRLAKDRIPKPKDD